MKKDELGVLFMEERMGREEEARDAWVLQKAWWMAMSGVYADCADIERAIGNDRLVALRLRLGSDTELRTKIDDVCRASSKGVSGLAPTISGDPDSDAVFAVLDAEHVANWQRDMDGFAATHAQTDYERWWAWIRFGGVSMRDGWATLDRKAREDIAMDPDQNPFIAFSSRRENINLRISGSMAWITYDMVFPTTELWGFHGPGRGHEVRILEKFDGKWKIVFVGIIDDQFGQTDIPTWEIDLTGRVKAQNHAADVHLKGDTEIGLRGGRLHMRDSATNTKLYDAIAWLARNDLGFMSHYNTAPVVFDPGNDLPARVWWAKSEAGRLFVVFNDPLLAEQKLMEAATTFGLSPSQQRLVVLVIAGKTLTEAARLAGVRISTARTQLQRIFDKLGVRTQPALVKMLLTAHAPS
ncbi:MAG: transcriptional regulator, LuxR family [Devosia sp.]|nr:transcriptional regulator, LuxR family [Devosia sp.]